MDEPAPEPFPTDYLDHKAMGESLRRAAATYPRALRVRSLATTRQGREVWLATIGHDDVTDAPSPHPSLLLVANLEADHLVGSQVALGLVEALAEREARDPELNRLLDQVTIYVVPRLNPDGAERLLTAPRESVRTNMRPLDRDRDGRTSEDGPEDLNGDGQITSMLVPDTAATLIPDEKDPRLFRKADPSKGERGRFSEYLEGIDNDHDGGLNEDPAGGVNLNRNWPYRWAEFDPEAGPTPVSEPEVQGLIRFAFDHPEIVAIWSFGLHDSLKEEPKKEGSGLDNADLPVFVELSGLFSKAIEKLPKDVIRAGSAVPAAPDWPQPDPTAGPIEAPSPARGPLTTDSSSDGSVSEWAYHHFGVVRMGDRLWYGPEFGDPPKDGPAPPKEGDARWLYWNDHVVDGKAFAPFTPLKHPTLGPVLIGGWKPGVRVNPPARQIEALTATRFEFLKEVVKRFPSLALSGVKAKSLGGGLFEVTTTVENRGTWPTALERGVRLKQAPSVLVRLDAPGATVLNGPARTHIDRLAGGNGRREFRWLLAAPETARSVTVSASCLKAGRVSQTIELKP